MTVDSEKSQDLLEMFKEAWFLLKVDYFANFGAAAQKGVGECQPFLVFGVCRQIEHCCALDGHDVQEPTVATLKRGDALNDGQRLVEHVS